MSIAGSLRHGKNQVCCPARKIISLSVVTLPSSDCGGYIMMFNENKQVGPIGATASALSGKIPANQPPDQTSLTRLPSCCKTPGFRTHRGFGQTGAEATRPDFEATTISSCFSLIRS